MSLPLGYFHPKKTHLVDFPSVIAILVACKAEGSQSLESDRWGNSLEAFGNRGEKKWILSKGSPRDVPQFLDDFHISLCNLGIHVQTNHGSNFKITCTMYCKIIFLNKKKHIYVSHSCFQTDLDFWDVFIPVPHNRNIQLQLLRCANCTGILVAALSHFSKPPEPTLEIHGINVDI